MIQPQCILMLQIYSRKFVFQLYRLQNVLPILLIIEKKCLTVLGEELFFVYLRHIIRWNRYRWCNGIVERTNPPFRIKVGP